MDLQHGAFALMSHTFTSSIWQGQDQHFLIKSEECFTQYEVSWYKEHSLSWEELLDCAGVEGKGVGYLSPRCDQGGQHGFRKERR